MPQKQKNNSPPFKHVFNCVFLNQFPTKYGKCFDSSSSVQVQQHSIGVLGVGGVADFGVGTSVHKPLPGKGPSCHYPSPVIVSCRSRCARSPLLVSARLMGATQTVLGPPTFDAFFGHCHTGSLSGSPSVGEGGAMGMGAWGSMVSIQVAHGHVP